MSTIADPNLVAELAQRDLRALAEAVVSGDEEEDAQRAGGTLHGRLAAQRIRAAAQHIVEAGRATHTP
ncbi:MAG TPA: hypothetical protein VFZ89_20105 [Solirubrobacteraceae bacterium]